MSDAAKPGAPEVLALEIETPGGTLRGRLAVPPGEMRLPELAWNFMGMSDRFTDLAVQREAREGKAISCRKGCGACCRQVVPLSPPEAWMLADLVAGMPPAAQASVIASFEAASAALDEAGLKAGFLGPIATDDELKALSIGYFRLGLACPFLKDEACSIHRFRPSICREYLVTSPAENCAELGLKKVDRIPLSVRLSESLSRLTAKLVGGEPQVIPLTLALEWAAAHREDGRRRWNARFLVESLVAELAVPPSVGA